MSSRPCLSDRDGRPGSVFLDELPRSQSHGETIDANRRMAAEAARFEVRRVLAVAEPTLTGYGVHVAPMPRLGFPPTLALAESLAALVAAADTAAHLRDRQKEMP